jgi:SAM-dependent methyltransferase
MTRTLRACAAALGLSLFLPIPIHAETTTSASAEYAPSVGQPGKDVVWVPTPDALVTHMLRMAKVTSQDFVMDLGSGDGRIAIAAAKEFGARAEGIEYNPDLVTLSNKAAQQAGVADKVKFIKADIFETDFGKASVITMYLLPRLNVQLRPKILALKPGTRVVSHAFTMDDWKPDEQALVEAREAFLWIVPAQLGGNWRLNSGGEQLDLRLEQKYQMLGGKAQAGKSAYEIQSGRVRGEEVYFDLIGPKGERREFSGRLNNAQLEGSVKTASGAPVKWTAVRSANQNAALSTTSQ